MGSWLSYFWGSKSAEFDTTPGLDDLDPSSGLTKRQKRVIIENWSMVLPNFKQLGIEFFLELFKAHPSYQKQFKSIATLSQDELRKSKKLAAHASDVMYGLAAMIENLDDVECLKEQNVRMGKNHVRRNVTAEQFENLSVVFVDFLQSKLGNKFTPFAKNAWEKLWEAMISMIRIGLESAKA